ncbi:uncharacterized protein V1518DRAFT_203971 [Limtongia smithiae]|uniref:uncharacterized protein n=1 Tax=Limtongia smithiae TaxID=1125753 RepID=UPI0034CD51B5
MVQFTQKSSVLRPVLLAIFVLSGVYFVFANYRIQSLSKQIKVLVISADRESVTPTTTATADPASATTTDELLAASADPFDDTAAIAALSAEATVSAQLTEDAAATPQATNGAAAAATPWPSTATPVHPSQSAALKDFLIDDDDDDDDGDDTVSANVSRLTDEAVKEIIADENVMVIGAGDFKRKVYFLLPSTQVNVLACKTIFSSTLNGFPKPVLLNYGITFRTEFEAHFMKIAAINEFLQHKDLDADDIVLIMDAYDVWFQLPFSTLLDRYFRLQDGDRVKYNSQRSATDPPFAERVIFGADKRCWPNNVKSPACTAVPESTLPEDIYGPNTDNDRFAFRNRGRWLNSGNIMGSVGSMRVVYGRAYDFAKNMKAHFSDQFVVAEIFGRGNVPIRIDYESYLFQTMTLSHADVLFIDEEQVESDADLDVDLTAPGNEYKELRAWIRDNRPDVPFYAEDRNPKTVTDENLLQMITASFLTKRNSKPSRRHIAWNRVSANTPVLLHFNGPKAALDTWWNKMWWVYDNGPKRRGVLLDYAYDNGGMYVDINRTDYRSYDNMCGEFDIWEFKGGKFDNKAIRPGSWPSLDPEPFIVGMDPSKSPSDGWQKLLDDHEADLKREKEQKARAQSLIKSGKGSTTAKAAVKKAAAKAAHASVKPAAGATASGKTTAGKVTAGTGSKSASAASKDSTNKAGSRTGSA